MPLILFCGFPCSGKSLIATRLAEKILDRLPDGCKVEIVSEEAIARGNSTPTANQDDCNSTTPDPRAAIYASANLEKQLRSQIKSGTERVLGSNKSGGRSAANGPDTMVVIVDANNYIKGYRYEMHCVAKSMRHPQAVVHCTTDVETCRQSNKQLSRYPEDLFDNLVSRFEKPNPVSRWDNPLYEIALPVAGGGVEPEEELDQLIDVLAGRVVSDLLQSGAKVKPNPSTVRAKTAATNFLQVIDNATNCVIKLIMEAQSRGDAELRLPNQEDAVLDLANNTKEEAWTPATLAKAKRNFLGFVRFGLGAGVTARVTNQTSEEEVSALFVRFLGNEAQKPAFLT